MEGCGSTSSWTKNLLPKKRDVFGNEQLQTSVALWSPTIATVAREMNDKVLSELIAHDVGVAWPGRRRGETSEQNRNRAMVVGRAVDKELRAVVESPGYDYFSDELKVLELEGAVRSARAEVNKDFPKPTPQK